MYRGIDKYTDLDTRTSKIEFVDRNTDLRMEDMRARLTGLSASFCCVDKSVMHICPRYIHMYTYL